VLQTVQPFGAAGQGRIYLEGTFAGQAALGTPVQLDFYGRDPGQKVTLLGSKTFTQTTAGTLSFTAVLAAELAPGSQIAAAVHGASGGPNWQTALAVGSAGRLAANGLPVALESLAAAQGIGRQSGSADALLPNVASVPAMTNGEFVTLVAPAGDAITDVQVYDTPPGGTTLPFGLIGFKVHTTPGGSASVRVLLPDDVAVGCYYKQDPVTGKLTSFDYDGHTGAEIADAGHIVTLHLVDGSVAGGDADGVANGIIDDPGGGGTITITGKNISATEGTAASSVLVATFTDTDGNTDPTKYSVTISWGDNATSAGTVSYSGGVFNVTGTHTYAEEGTFSLGIQTVTDSDGTSASKSPSGTATVGDAALSASGTSINAAEGISFTTVLASFTDADPGGTASDYTATITNWGDGSGTSSGTVAANGSGGFNVTGTHTYAAAGTYTITISIADSGGSSATATTTAHVADISPTSATVTPVETVAFTGVVATFHDAGSLSNFSATITNWGDGASSNGTIAAGNGSGNWTITGTHTYAEEGTNAISISINDTDGYSATVTSTANVSDAALSSVGGTTNYSGTEGAATPNQVVATFTDADVNGVLSDYSATIAWGDGSANSSGTISLVSGTTFNVSAAHAFAEEGTFTPTVTITDSGGSSVTASNTTYTIADAALTSVGTATNYTGTEGSATPSQVVATFTDADPGALASDYSATITWVDNTTSSGTISLVSGTTFNVSASHAFPEEGTSTASVKITDAAGNSVTATNTTYTVSDAALSATASNVSAIEGVAVTATVASFTDADSGGTLSDYSATITWGDGNSSAGTIASNGSGGFTVSGTNTYAMDGSFTITVTIHDSGGAVTAPTSTATVADLTAYGTTLAATEGSSWTGTVATFQDAGSVGNYTVSINWGDNSNSAGTVTAGSSAGNWTVSGTHTYAEEKNYSVTVSISDSDTSSASATTSATVADAALNSSGQSISPKAGWVFIGKVATFSDPATATDTGVVYTASISWGDGSGATSGTISGGNVSGSHLYLVAGTYTVTTTITDDGGSTTTATGTATVSYTPPGKLLVTGMTLTPTEGTALTNVTVATFLDSDGSTSAAAYAATIDWGDGTATTPGTVAGSGGVSGFTVTGSHTYAENASFLITVTLSDGDGARGSGQGTAYVSDAALSDTGSNLSATQGTVFSGTLLTFSDGDAGGTASDYTALINWGDGQLVLASLGTITGTGPFTVTGSHDFAAAGSDTITVTVLDNGGSRASATDAMTVAASALTFTAGSLSPVEGNGASAVLATFTDPDGNTDPSKYTASINWGDGTASTSGTVIYQAGSGFQISAGHPYAEEGPYPVAITVTDSDHTTAGFSGTATVSDAALTASGVAVSATAGQPFVATVASFSDADPGGMAGDYQATITWGDSSTPTTGSIVVNGSSFQVKAGHVYAASGSDTITITLADAGGATTTFTTTATVSAATQGVSGLNFTATEGQAFSGNVASFTPPPGNPGASGYAVNIGWGDGKRSAGTLVANGNSYWISGSHTYADETSPTNGPNLPYPVTISVRNLQNPTTTLLTAGATATVNDAALTPTGQTLLGWTGIATGSMVLGSFTDANPSASVKDYAVSISWGDGSGPSAGTVQPAQGGGLPSWAITPIPRPARSPSRRP
jgi:hypothetical protein